MRQYRESVLETNQLEKIMFEGKNEQDEKECLICHKSFKVDEERGFCENCTKRRDHFDICEDCYDEWISSFAVPMESVEKIV